MDWSDDIVLPDGRRIPARAGRYVVQPPPDLNAMDEGDEDRFLLEYAAPYLIVRDRALPSKSDTEFQSSVYQACTWQSENRPIGGITGGSRSGYAFADGDGTQFWIPGGSYVDASNWESLTVEARDALYLPRTSRCIAAGTREAVVIDTQEDRVWIHNQGETPYFDSPLATIEFDAWPGFTLDCVAVRDAGLSVFQQ